MTEVPDADLLGQFAREHSETAFAALVERHIGLVHSVALRHTAHPQHAEDITQAVFVILARKAGALGRKTVLPGWLYHTARLTAANWQRAETRRIRREQETFMQSTYEESPPDALWRELSPQLDEAMAGLGARERDVLLLRYFQNKSMAEVGQVLGLAENTAQKRVGRALDKLRKFFTKRGVDSTTASIADSISTHSVQAVPVGLVKSVTAVAVAKGAMASASTLTLIKGALKIMAWSKMKTIVVSATIILVTAAAVTSLAMNRYKEHRHWMWRVQEPTPDLIRRATPQVTIVSTKFKSTRWVTADDSSARRIAANDSFAGIAQPARIVVGAAYSIWGTHLVEDTPLPMGRYDFIANLPDGSLEAFQAEVKKQFGVVAHRETSPTDVLLLRIKTPDAPGLLPSQPSSVYSERQENGEYILTHGPINRLEGLFGFYFEKPVINQTGLNGLYDFRLKVDWKKRDPAAVKQDLLDQLGLELVPSREPIEMLVVEKVK